MTNDLQKSELTSPLASAAELVKADGNMDVDKLGKVLEMQERWDATQAKKAYVTAMSAFQAVAPKILKQKTGHNCKYAGLSDIVSVIAPKLSEHGLSHTWVTEPSDKEVKVTCKITHVLGHSETTSLSAAPDTSGSKNSIQALGSTITYLQRYTLKAVLGLAEEDQDDDGEGANKTDNLPAKPNEAEQEVLTAICEQLAKQTKKKVLGDVIAGMFYGEYKQYPKKPESVPEAVEWVLSLNRADEWTESSDMKKLMEAIDQAYFIFTTDNVEHLPNEQGKVVLDKDIFIRAVTKTFGTLPVDKSAREIAEAIKPEDVAIKVEDK